MNGSAHASPTSPPLRFSLPGPNSRRRRGPKRPGATGRRTSAAGWISHGESKAPPIARSAEHDDAERRADNDPLRLVGYSLIGDQRIVMRVDNPDDATRLHPASSPPQNAPLGLPNPWSRVRLQRRTPTASLSRLDGRHPFRGEGTYLKTTPETTTSPADSAVSSSPPAPTPQRRTVEASTRPSTARPTIDQRRLVTCESPDENACSDAHRFRTGRGSYPRHLCPLHSSTDCVLSRGPQRPTCNGPIPGLGTTWRIGRHGYTSPGPA